MYDCDLAKLILLHPVYDPLWMLKNAKFQLIVQPNYSKNPGVENFQNLICGCKNTIFERVCNTRRVSLCFSVLAGIY